MLLRNANRVISGLRARPGVPWWQDALTGAVLGDFAPQLGLAGAAAQIGLTMVPGIGDVCIMRDIVADMRAHDNVDIALNVIALTPFIGGAAKTAEVLRNARRAGQMLHLIGRPGMLRDGDGVGRG